MVRIYEGRGLGDIYYALIRDITQNGVEISTRGKRCLELPGPVVLVYKEPGYCWMDVPGRKFNPFFAMAEVPWILSGNGNVDWISYFNANMRSFADPGEEDFHGSYGLRIRRWPGPIFDMDSEEAQKTLPKTHRPANRYYMQQIDQIQHVVRKLKEDPSSRQAVIALWDPVRDNLVKSKDHPCNNIVYYRFRDGLLHQTVVIRSNDVIWGTPHNAIQFTHLHALIAGELGAKMGDFTYFVQNLHYYTDDTYSSTLGHIIKAAMSEESLDSQAIEGFCTATTEDIQICVDEINSIKIGRGLILHGGHEKSYWRSLIPRLLRIYITNKEHAFGSEVLAEEARRLPKPLPKLIHEFWKDSKNPASAVIANALR